MASRSSAHSSGSTSLRHRRTYRTAAPSASSSAGVNHRDNVPGASTGSPRRSPAATSAKGGNGVSRLHRIVNVRTRCGTASATSSATCPPNECPTTSNGPSAPSASRTRVASACWSPGSPASMRQQRTGDLSRLRTEQGRDVVPHLRGHRCSVQQQPTVVQRAHRCSIVASHGVSPMTFGRNCASYLSTPTPNERNRPCTAQSPSRSRAGAPAELVAHGAPRPAQRPTVPRHVLVTASQRRRLGSRPAGTASGAALDDRLYGGDEPAGHKRRRIQPIHALVGVLLAAFAVACFVIVNRGGDPLQQFDGARVTPASSQLEVELSPGQ